MMEYIPLIELLVMKFNLSAVGAGRQRTSTWV